MFCTSSPALDYIDPLTAGAVRANGAGAWWGWPSDAPQEDFYNRWLFSTSPAEGDAIEAQMQQRALDNAWVVPLGQYFQSSAWRATLTGFQKGPAPVFWNLQKS